MIAKVNINSKVVDFCFTHIDYRTRMDECVNEIMGEIERLTRTYQGLYMYMCEGILILSDEPVANCRYQMLDLKGSPSEQISELKEILSARHSKSAA